MTARGLYADPAAARAALEAIGGAPVPRVAFTPESARGVYLGRCANGEHKASYAGFGEARVLIEKAADGCGGEIAHGYNPLRLCAACLAKYRAAASPERRDHVAYLDTYERDPGLCGHGQRGTCGSCDR